MSCFNYYHGMINTNVTILLLISIDVLCGGLALGGNVNG